MCIYLRLFLKWFDWVSEWVSEILGYLSSQQTHFYKNVEAEIHPEHAKNVPNLSKR